MLDWKLLAGAAGIVAAVVFVIWLIFFCARRIREHLKGRELDAMEGHDFEYFCADLLEDHGFKSVEVTRGSQLPFFNLIPLLPSCFPDIPCPTGESSASLPP